MIYGLYKQPPASVDDCPVCDNIGGRIASLQMVIANLEKSRQDWIEDNVILSADLFPKIQMLMALYVQFYLLGFTIHEIWVTNVLQDLTGQLIRKAFNS